MKHITIWIFLLFLTLSLLTSCSIRPRKSRVADSNAGNDKVVIKFSEDEKQQSDEESILEFLGEESATDQQDELLVEEENDADSDASTDTADEKTSAGDEAQSETRAKPNAENRSKQAAKMSPKEDQTDVESLVQEVEAVVRNQPAGRYVVGDGDVLEFKFFKNSEYNEKVKVRPDGFITLEHIGELKVTGKTPAEITDLVTAAYSKILVEPQITMFVREFSGHFCYVMGEVEEPGQYKVVNGMSIMRAIASAGGSLRSGKMNSVIVIRGDQNRNTEISRVNLSISSLAKKEGNDLRVRPFDIIYVPRTFISNLDAFVKRIYDYAVPPLDLWIKYKYWDRWTD